MNHFRVKICCIKSIEEARLAIASGADAVGLVGQMPSGPGIIDDEHIRKIAASIRDEVQTFLLTSEVNAKRIIDHYYRTQTSTIQLVDDVPIKDLEEIRKTLPNVRIVQVIHVQNSNSVLAANAVCPYVDHVLLDSGNPNSKVKTLGGTGATHNWNLSREIVETVSVPVFLAGGLNHTNIKMAIEKVNPFGVDLCSGVRTNDQLDKSKLELFMLATGKN